MGYDNAGRNTFWIFRNVNESKQIMHGLWDLDGTLGRDWNRIKRPATNGWLYGSSNTPNVNGKQYFKLFKRIIDGEEFSKQCPKCKGSTWYSDTRPAPQKEVEYYEYYPEYDVIESVNANISKNGVKYTYCLKQYGAEDEVFKTRDEALVRAEEKSKQSFDKAKMKLEGKKIT
jgi:hypothetical protein